MLKPVPVPSAEAAAIVPSVSNFLVTVVVGADFPTSKVPVLSSFIMSVPAAFLKIKASVSPLSRRTNLRFLLLGPMMSAKTSEPA